MTKPRVLDDTRLPVFLEVQKELSVLSDLISKAFGLPNYHMEEDIHLKFARKLHPLGLYPAWRAAVHGPDHYIEVHEDALNDSRKAMSPVGVLSCMYQTREGPIRLTKIGYSRQSLHDSLKREALIKPVVREFLSWEQAQPTLMKEVSSNLLLLQPNSDLPGVIEIPCHLERSVGVSPFIHAIIKLQCFLGLTRSHCVALAYNCVTNESPFFFYSAYEDILALQSTTAKKELSEKSPVELGVWFHDIIWKKIIEKREGSKRIVLPRRHQPYNPKRPSDVRIAMSISNLI
jgi:hypothetical protein